MKQSATMLRNRATARVPARWRKEVERILITDEQLARRVQQMSREILRVEQGSLYPALYRLEAQGWIRAKWGVSDNNRKARYYELTAAGRKQLAAEREHWSRITRGINLVLTRT